MRRGERWMAAAMLLIATSVSAQTGPPSLPAVPGHTCTPVTQAHADASAGTANVNHDGSPLPGIPAPDISRGFQGIPRLRTAAADGLAETHPRVHVSPRRGERGHAVHAVRAVQLCAWNAGAADRGSPRAEHHAAHADPVRRHHRLRRTLRLHRRGADGVQRVGLVGLARRAAVATAQTKPGTEDRYSSSELSEIDAMTLLKSIRQAYAIDSDRIYLMGHSMGGAGTYYLGAKYNDIWAGIAPISGAGGIADAAAAERYRSFVTLLMHGEKDSIVSPCGITSRGHAAAGRRRATRVSGVPRQGSRVLDPARQREHGEGVPVFLDVSKRTNKGFITPDMLPRPQSPGRG